MYTHSRTPRINDMCWVWHWEWERSESERERDGRNVRKQVSTFQHFAICGTYVWHGFRSVHVTDLLGEISNVAQIWWQKWLKSFINLIGVTSNGTAEKVVSVAIQARCGFQEYQTTHSRPLIQWNSSFAQVKIASNLFFWCFRDITISWQLFKTNKSSQFSNYFRNLSVSWKRF